MSRRWTIGVDFGGTNVKVGLVSARGHVHRSRMLPTKAIGRPAAFIEGLSQAVGSLARMVGLAPAQLRGVGVGVPGPVDATRGLVYSTVNVPGWHEVPLRAQLERRLRCPCAIDNDVNLVALGEWRVGAGRGSRNLICLTLGTGVGGGLILNGSLYRGSRGAAGELGHMVIDPRGRRCGCGARGCLEAEVGTAAILAMGRAALRRGTEPLRTLVRASGGRLSPELISQAARRGDRAARAIWMQVGCWLGVGLANLVNLLNPERIIIGGGVANAWGLFYPTLIRTVRAQAMAVSSQTVRILRAELGNSAGVVGAAVLVWDERGAKGHGAWGEG